MSRLSLGDLLLVVLLAMLGCGSPSEATTSGKGPDWIDRPNGVFDEGSSRVVYAVGSAAEVNPAKFRARAELARSMSVLVQSMVKDYMGSNRDFYQMDAASSVEYSEDIARLVSEETLAGSESVETYRDPIDKSCYVLMRIDFQKVMDTYRYQMQASYAREAARRRIKATADEFERQLDEQLRRLSDTEAGSLDEVLGEG